MQCEICHAQLKRKRSVSHLKGGLQASVQEAYESYLTVVKVKFTIQLMRESMCCRFISPYVIKLQTCDRRCGAFFFKFSVVLVEIFPDK